MYIGTAFILLPVVVHANIKELAASHMCGKQNSMDKLVERLVSRLFNQVQMVSSLYHADLDTSTLNKNGHPPAHSDSFGRASCESTTLEATLCSVNHGLQRLYKKKLLPVEEFSHFHWFHSPELTDADFAYRPMVLLVGQYSTGKTTFVRHLLERDYPGIRIGPEPTTDKFVCIAWGEHDQVIPGHSFVTDPSLPFQQFSSFGNEFLLRVEMAKLNSSVLEGVTFIDTPGVLAGDKQTTKRGYDFEGVVKSFADKVDMVVLMFDAHKLDISDEFKRCIRALKGNDQKIHLILNMADQVTTQQLMRVYGALMWQLSKIVDTPEVIRVYVGSFWDGPLLNEGLRELFEHEENSLYTHIAQLPRDSSVRKVNDVIKRARLAKVHAILLSHLRKVMPIFLSKTKAKQKVLDDLPKIYEDVAKLHNIPLGDFPSVKHMQEKLKEFDFSTLRKLDKKERKKMEALDIMLKVDVPALLELIPEEQKELKECVPRKSNHNRIMRPWDSDFTPTITAKSAESACPEAEEPVEPEERLPAGCGEDLPLPPPS